MRPLLGSLRGFGRGLPLYGALLVLPAVVLVVLHALGLHRAYTSDRDAIPLRAETDRLRLAELMSERFQLFLDDEEQRPYFQYADTVSPGESFTEDLVLMSSPILDDPVDPSLQAWFFADLARGPAPPDMIFNENANLGPGDEPADLGLALSELVSAVLPSTPPPSEYDILSVPMITAAVHANRASNEDCLRTCLPLMHDRRVPVAVSRLRPLLFRDAAGELRLAAVREVTPADTLSDFGGGLPLEVPRGGRCLEVLADGFHLVQGFLVDPAWVFRGMAEELAPLALAGDARLAAGIEARLPAGEDELKRTLDLVTLFGIQPAPDLVLPRVDLAILSDTAGPRVRYRASILRFSAVVVMMVLSLGTGLVLLLGGVRQRLAQARRTENFVAAVTHELRTPLASIKLHGEMLVDGIASTPEARSEYYKRILGETERLSLLVENVLQKSSLDSEAATSEPGDLSAMVRLMELELQQHGSHYVSGQDAGTLTFELADGLPEVLVQWDAINGILRNLVGNARKYGGDGSAVVRTRRSGGEVLLEVLDRGPGVPRGEERRVFEAFYRTGDEATREHPGTGLGLHLVQLHAAALGAEARYRHREGGGAAFVVAFQPAR